MLRSCHCWDPNSLSHLFVHPWANGSAKEFLGKKGGFPMHCNNGSFSMMDPEQKLWGGFPVSQNHQVRWINRIVLYHGGLHTYSGHDSLWFRSYGSPTPCVVGWWIWALGHPRHRQEHPRLRREVVDAIDVLIQHGLRPEPSGNPIGNRPKVNDPSGPIVSLFVPVTPMKSTFLCWTPLPHQSSCMSASSLMSLLSVDYVLYFYTLKRAGPLSDQA